MRGPRAGEAYSVNLPVQNGSYEAVWFSLLEHIVIPAAEEFQFDLVLIYLRRVPLRVAVVRPIPCRLAVRVLPGFSGTNLLYLAIGG